MKSLNSVQGSDLIMLKMLKSVQDLSCVLNEYEMHVADLNIFWLGVRF